MQTYGEEPINIIYKQAPKFMAKFAAALPAKGGVGRVFFRADIRGLPVDEYFLYSCF